MAGISTPVARPLAAPDHLRRVVGVALMAMIALVLAMNLMALAGDPTAAFGSDWYWYVDGPDRLFAGLPLFDPRLLAGPYMQLDPEFVFTWNQAPSLVAPIALIEVVVPDQLEVAFWSGLMLASIAAAFAVVWPSGLSRRATVMLALLLAVLPPLLWGFWWANASCVVALGTGLVIAGERRGSDRLIVAGLLLAGVAKILPAVPLVIWLLARRRPVRPIVIATAIGGALLLPVLVVTGPAVLGEFLVITQNAVIAGSGSNVAPMVYLSFVFGKNGAALISYVAAAPVALYALRRRSDLAMLFWLTIACDLLVQNLWIHWLITPLVIAVAMIGPVAKRRLELAAGGDVVAAPAGSSPG